MHRFGIRPKRRLIEVGISYMQMKEDVKSAVDEGRLPRMVTAAPLLSYAKRHVYARGLDDIYAPAVLSMHQEWV